MENVKYSRNDITKKAVPGTWQSVEHEPDYNLDRDTMAYLCCRKCGHRTIIRTHKIADDGTVTPSLVCPIQGCDEHVMGTLMEWQS